MLLPAYLKNEFAGRLFENSLIKEGDFQQPGKSGFKLFDIFIPAFVAAKTMYAVVILDPNARVFGDIGSADRVFDQNALFGPSLVFFGFELSFFLPVIGVEFVQEKTGRRKNKKSKHTDSLGSWVVPGE
jgi:hypothetical protein